jgi:type IV pilus assembly protein PilZ
MLCNATMTEERRSAHRARISGVRVTYESAAGDRVETEAVDLGRGGLFVRSEKPIAVGRRISLEIQLVGEPEPWMALGRVVWTREQGIGVQRPPGMGVKIIDVDDAAATTIDRLVAARTPTAHAVEQPGAAFTGKRTMVGVGSTAEITPAVPVEPVTIGREKTILGVGSSAPRGPDPSTTPEPGATREVSVAIDLVAKKHEPPGGSLSSSPEFEEPASAKRGGGGRWIVVLVLLAAIGTAVYVLLDGDFERLLRLPGPHNR